MWFIRFIWRYAALLDYDVQFVYLRQNLGDVYSEAAAGLLDCMLYLKNKMSLEPMFALPDNFYQ
jgi:hypothetical protein